jgi:S-adenosylmethionine synthetase
VIAEAGYPAGEGDAPTVMLDIAQTADHAPGAGQMTTAFGFACTDTPEALPMSLAAAHRLSRALDAARREGRFGWLSPDAQVQVAVRYQDRKPVEIPAIAFALGLRGEVSIDMVRAVLHEEVIPLAFAGLDIGPHLGTRLICQGASVPEGPQSHSGLTGRKTGIDTFGGIARQSAAALSGKSPARIDRISQYAARTAALAVVRGGLARHCEVQLSYLLGEATPVTVEVDTFDTATRSDAEIEQQLAKAFDFRPEAIAERFGLWDLPAGRGGRFFRDLACYGQMGRVDLDAPWERAELAASLG